MRTFKTLIGTAIAASIAVGAVAPAMAATPYRAQGIRNQIEELERRVNRNDNRDRISEREAARLRGDVRNLKVQFRTYNANGLSAWEMRTLEQRIQTIKARLSYERRDGDGRRW